MSAPGWHLAQVNIALPKEPLDSPALAEFVALLEPVNALADGADGFVWRLQTEGGDATAVKAFGDDRLLVNMSVWQSIEALWAYVYNGGHLAAMRRRREWFNRMAQMHLCLWWIPAGEVPTVSDAEERLGRLRADGPTPIAFTFKQRFRPPSSTENGSRNDPWRSPSRSG